LQRLRPYLNHLSLQETDMSLAERFHFDTDAVGDRLIEASRNLRDALQDTRSKISDRAAAGSDYARALSDEVIASSLRAGRTTRAAIVDRPVEAILIVGIAAFAIGWVARRLQESREASQTRATRRAAPSARARSSANGARRTSQREARS
jgi:hypothetical protein